MRLTRGNSELDLTDRGTGPGGNVRAGVGHSPSLAANRSSPTDGTPYQHRRADANTKPYVHAVAGPDRNPTGDGISAARAGNGATTRADPAAI